MSLYTIKQLGELETQIWDLMFQSEWELVRGLVAELRSALIREDTLSIIKDDGSLWQCILVGEGMIAAKQGRRSDALRCLKELSDLTPSASMSTFGPNLLLARALLELGETSAVMDHLRACKRYWYFGRDQIEAWMKEIEGGITPDFGANLKYC